MNKINKNTLVEYIRNIIVIMELENSKNTESLREKSEGEIEGIKYGVTLIEEINEEKIDIKYLNTILNEKYNIEFRKTGTEMSMNSSCLGGIEMLWYEGYFNSMNTIFKCIRIFQDEIKIEIG